MRIIFFGTPEFVIPVLKSLASNFELVGVVTTPDVIQGRKKLLTPSPVKQYTTQHLSIPALTFQQFSNETMQQLHDLNPDLLVVAAYGKIIPQSILNVPKNGALNIHPSLLPKYRGPSPIQTALLNGDKTTGVTVIKMDEKMDHGDIVSQWQVGINTQDTFASLHTSLFEDAAKKIPSIINEFITKKINPTPQDEASATFCKMITRESGYFDSENPPSPEKVDNMIRAYYPWPSAWTRLQMANGKWQMAKFYPEKIIQMEGKKPMTMKEFLNGYPELKQQLEKLLGMQH